MKTFIFGVIVLVCLGISFAQERLCFESPDAWSGNIIVSDYAQKRSTSGYIFYNRTQQRLHIIYREEFMENRDYLKKWFFYDTRKSYTLDEEAHTCTEEDMPPDESIPKFTAPAGAVFRHYDQIGSFIPNLGVSTEYLRMDTENGGVYHGYYAKGTISSLVCIPVIESYENIDTAPIHQRNTHVMYMNITTTPIDYLVWEVPGECFH